MRISSVEPTQRKRLAYASRLGVGLVLLACLSAPPALALTGRVSGIVRSEQKEPVPKLTLRFVPADGSATRELTTDKNGRFKHFFFPTGTYRIEVAEEGRFIQWMSFRHFDASGVVIQDQAGSIDPKQGFPALPLGADERIELELEVVGAETLQQRSREMGLAAVSKDLAAVTASFEAGDMQAVLDTTASLLEKDSEVGAVHYLRGMAQSRLGESEAAIESLRRAVALSPDQSGFEGALGTALVQRGIDLNDADDARAAEVLSEASDLLEREIARTPDSTPLLLNSAMALERLERRAELIERLRRLVELAPDPREHRMWLAESLLADDEPAEALAVLKQMPGDARDIAPMVYNVAAKWFNDGNLDEAIGAAETGLQFDPRLPDLYRLLGRAYLSKGDNERAITALTEFVKLSPDDPSADVERELIRRLAAGSAP